MRRAYLFVDNTHPLFAHETLRRVEKNARRILDVIQAQRSLKLPTIDVELKQQLTHKRLTEAVGAALGGHPQPDVRALYGRGRIAPAVLQVPFRDTELLVLIEEAGGDALIRFQAAPLPASCTVRVLQEKAAGLLEDLIVELTLANFFRKTDAVGSLVDRAGLPALYAAKVAFARRALSGRGGVSVSAGASYALLSSMVDHSRSDVDGRAQAIWSVWSAFADQLTARPMKTTARLGAATEARPLPFLDLLKIGGQLSPKRLQRSVSALPDGDYVIVIQRASAKVRKSPKLRDQLASVFPPRARLNAHRFLPLDEYLENRKIVASLADSGHIAVVRFAKRGVDIVLEPSDRDHG